MKKISYFCILMSFLLLATFLIGLPTHSLNKAFASSSADALNYVSLGDSIADGYGLAGYSSKGENELVANSYAYKFNSKLKGKYTSINSISYAKSGDNTADLISKLESNTLMQNSIKDADIILICIGANDILGPATENFINFVLYNEDISGPLDQGLNTFSTNFVTILNKLYALNPTAKKLFTNVYNPYKELISAKNDLVIDMTSATQTITAQKIYEIGNITEKYISGNMAGIVGLNQRLKGFIDGIDATTNLPINVSNDNCYYVDSKSLFDAYAGGERLTNADILDYTKLTASFATVGKVLLEHMDPHPTIAGHTLIYNAFANLFDNRFALVEFDYDGGKVEEKTNDINLLGIGAKIAEPAQKPIKNGYICTGWTYFDGTNAVDFNFTSDIYEDIVISAKWVEVCVVTFNSVGGSAVESQTLNAGEKIARPQAPLKTGSSDVFVGWYYFNNLNEPVFWDFENDIVTKSLTLIARWANSICLNTDLLIQDINNIQDVEFKIDVDANIQWYVNDNIQVGENGKTYTFTPPENAGEYRVYCVVNGVETKRHTVVINYIVPTTITAVISTISDKNLYSFSIENGNYIDGSKCVWYATIDQFTDEVEEIGYGTTCRTRLDKNCKVYVVYNGSLNSNYLDIDPPMVIGTDIYLVVGVTLAIAAFVTLLTIISRKRYKNYY